MSHRTSTKTPAVAAEQATPAPKHQPFSQLCKSLRGKRQEEFAALTHDVCRGAQVALQLAMESEQDAVQVEGGGFLTLTQCGYLQMLAIQSFQMLGDIAEELLSDLNDVALRNEVRGAEGGAQ